MADTIIPDSDLDAISDDDLCEAINAIVSSMIRRACPEHGEEDKAAVREAMMIKQMRERFEEKKWPERELRRKVSALANGAQVSGKIKFCLTHHTLQDYVSVNNGELAIYVGWGRGYEDMKEARQFDADLLRCGWSGS